jgi:hypothetical protein
MRYVDIAVAALVGATAITGILAWSPTAGDTAASQFQEESDLRDWMLGFVQMKGMVWFMQTTADGICAATDSASNSTFHLSAQIGPVQCPSHPLDDATAAELSFELDSLKVTLISWSSAGG